MSSPCVSRVPLLPVIPANRHCAAISAAMLALPSGLAALGQDAELSSMVRTYILALLPSVWLEAVTRWVGLRGTALQLAQ